MIGVGIIGYGYWGPNLVRNFVETPDCRVVSVSDLRTDRLALVTSRYPHIATTTDCDELLDDPKIDAVAVCTPVSSHFDLATKALSHGKHVLVEKPLAANEEQAQELVNLAERRRLTLMVDQTFVYTAAVRKMRQIIDSGELGNLFYYDSVRVNLGLFQRDIDVVWDLAPHDLSILDYLVQETPRAVSAIGTSHIENQHHNLAYLTITYDNQFIAHLHVNWLSPVKIRRTLIGGSRRMIVYDDLESSEKVKVYNRGVDCGTDDEGAYRTMIEYRTGDMWAPHIPTAEALLTETRHFVECITTGQKPITDGHAGLRVVRILDAASRSMARQGALVEIGL